MLHCLSQSIKRRKQKPCCGEMHRETMPVCVTVRLCVLKCELVLVTATYSRVAGRGGRVWCVDGDEGHFMSVQFPPVRCAGSLRPIAWMDSRPFTRSPHLANSPSLHSGSPVAGQPAQWPSIHSFWTSPELPHPARIHPE